MIFFLLSCSSSVEPNEYSCRSNGKSTSELWEKNNHPTLLFQSGFEPDVTIVQGDEKSDDIIGVDSSMPAPNDWENDLEASPIGSFQVYYADGDSSQRSTALIEDPEDPNNQVLEFRLHKANELHLTSADKGRIQFGFNNNEELYALSYSTKMRFQEGFSLLPQHPDAITWLTVAEFWNNIANESFPFRITLNINKEDGIDAPLYWHMHAQNRIAKGDWNTIWDGGDKTVPVPIQEWFTLHVDLQEGCTETGWFRVRITLEDGTEYTIVDETQITQHPEDPIPDGFGAFNPLKLYTSSQTIDWVRNNGEDLVILWDDFYLYQGTQP